MAHRAGPGATCLHSIATPAVVVEFYAVRPYSNLVARCYQGGMPRRASKSPKQGEDALQAARRVIEKTERAVDPAVSAAALSKLGASKGGEARARSLTAKRRTEIAKKAAVTRWKKTQRAKTILTERDPKGR